MRFALDCLRKAAVERGLEMSRSSVITVSSKTAYPLGRNPAMWKAPVVCSSQVTIRAYSYSSFKYGVQLLRMCTAHDAERGKLLNSLPSLNNERRMQACVKLINADHRCAHAHVDNGQEFRSARSQSNSHMHTKNPAFTTEHPLMISISHIFLQIMNADTCVCC